MASRRRRRLGGGLDRPRVASTTPAERLLGVGEGWLLNVALDPRRTRSLAALLAATLKVAASEAAHEHPPDPNG